MKRIHGLLSLLIVVAAGCFGTMAMAQITSARLTGEITDATGALVPHVKVVAKNNGTNFAETAESSESGVYTFTALPPGVYTLTTELAGFAPHIEKAVTLTVGQSATLNIALKTGGTQDTVTVTGGTELINTTTAEISNTVGEDEVKELPLNGRDPSSLVYLSAGVTNETISQAASTQTQQSFSTQTGASAGGGRQGSTWYLLDGVMNMDTTTLLVAPFPNADATQEFKVITQPELVLQTAHKMIVTSVAFSPDGRMLISGSFDGTIKLWDTAGSSELRSIDLHEKLSDGTTNEPAVYAASIAPDGKSIATAVGDRIILWTASKAIARPQPGRIMDLAFDPLGRWIATASDDGAVRLWDAVDLRLLQTGQLMPIAHRRTD